MAALGNLLNLALSIIPPCAVEYKHYNGSATVNDLGYVQSAYDSAVKIPNAHVQPLKNSMYEQFGLQLNMDARKVFIPADVRGMETISVGGDLIVFEGKTWTIKAVEDWYAYDGWKSLIVVREKAYNGVPNGK